MEHHDQKECSRCGGTLILHKGIPFCNNCRDSEKRLLKAERRRLGRERELATKQALDALVVNCKQCGCRVIQTSLKRRDVTCADCKSKAKPKEWPALNESTSAADVGRALAWGTFLLGGLFLILWSADQEQPSSISTPSPYSISTPAKPKCAVQPSVWDGSVQKAKEFIEQRVHDPRSVNYNEWSNWENSDYKYHVTKVDFTATNRLGGPTRVVWQFLFYSRNGSIKSVLDLSNETVLLDDGSP